MSLNLGDYQWTKINHISYHAHFFSEINHVVYVKLI